MNCRVYWFQRYRYTKVCCPSTSILRRNLLRRADIHIKLPNPGHVVNFLNPLGIHSLPTQDGNQTKMPTFFKPASCSNSSMPWFQPTRGKELAFQRVWNDQNWSIIASPHVWPWLLAQQTNRTVLAKTTSCWSLLIIAFSEPCIDVLVCTAY